MKFSSLKKNEKCKRRVWNHSLFNFFFICMWRWHGWLPLETSPSHVLCFSFQSIYYEVFCFQKHILTWCVFALAFSVLSATNLSLKSVGINMTYVIYLCSKRRNSVKANLGNHEYGKLYLLHLLKKV